VGTVVSLLQIQNKRREGGKKKSAPKAKINLEMERKERRKKRGKSVREEKDIRSVMSTEKRNQHRQTYG